MDGRHPSPFDRWIIPPSIGLLPSKVVQDFFYPQYDCDWDLRFNGVLTVLSWGDNAGDLLKRTVFPGINGGFEWLSWEHHLSLVFGRDIRVFFFLCALSMIRFFSGELR